MTGVASIPAPPSEEALAVYPVRTAAWSERDRRVVVERHLPQPRGRRGWLKLLSALTGVRRLRLDGPGSFAWRRFDGATPVGDVARGLAAELGEPDEDAATRVVAFVRILRREGLVGLAGLDDEAIAAWRARHPQDAPTEPAPGNPSP
jgi:hypothetical protein